MREPQHSQDVGLGKVALANFIWWSINFDEESHERVKSTMVVHETAPN